MVKIGDLRNLQDQNNNETVSLETESSILEDLSKDGTFQELFLDPVNEKKQSLGLIDISSVKVMKADGSFLSQKGINSQIQSNAAYNQGYIDALLFVESFFAQTKSLD